MTNLIRLRAFFLVFFVAVFQTTIGQVTVSTAAPSGLVYYSDTQEGVLVFGVRNTNPFSIIVTDIASYAETGHTGSYTLWYHPTAVTGAPTQVTAANGWIQLAPSGTTVNATSNAVIPVISGLNFVIPANTTYRLALQSPIHGPFYGVAGSTIDVFRNGGVEIYAQGNVNSPTYSGAFTAVPATTPRSFYGSITFRAAGSAVANNAGTLAVSAPTNFCPGNQDVKVKVANMGNNVINTLQVNWQLDGVLQTPVNWSTPIDISGSAGGNEALVTLGNVAFGTAARNLKIWTSLPNGGADPVSTDDTLNVSVRAKMNGTYTIGAAGADFPTIQSAVTALGNGICGPVTINITAASGPYNEQVVIPPISGTSATNKITINGNNNTLNFTSANTNARSGIFFTGADRITIKKLNIVAQSGSTYGWGVHFYNGANYNTIDSCTIDMSAVTSTTQSNSGGVVVSGALTAVTTDGNASNNTISNNNIVGGYQGIIITGTATSTNAVRNIITKNTIQDFYANGIELVDNDGALVEKNDISRKTRVTVTTFTGIEIGANCKNTVVDGNIIHDTHNAATTQSGTAYGIFCNAVDAPAGAENKIINNLIYNFNSTTGTQYGLYNSGSDSVFYYHNTVVLNHPGSTSGTTRGFYQLTAADGIKLKNNIFFVGRGGTGAKYCLYFGTSASNIESDYNDLVMTSSTGTTNAIGYYGATFTTFGNWQTANGAAYDHNSINIDPAFTNPATGNFLPTAPTANNKGTGVGVTTDILNVARHATVPDVGAYEFGTSLPVTWLSFTGEISGEINKLVWKTASEINNKGFYVEKSADGKNFSSLAFTVSKAEGGNSVSERLYRFDDLKPFAGNNYYRLRQMDKDGRFSYSNIVLLNRKVKEITFSAVYPNPARNELNIIINAPKAERITFIVSDLYGKVMIQAPASIQAGENLQPLNVGSLASGAYFIKAMCSDGCTSVVQKFMKQ